LDYRNPMHQPTQRRKGWGTVLGWTAAGFVALALLVSILLPRMGRARETAKRVKCASNLKQIGLAALLYSNENRGQLPPDFSAMLLTQDITAEVFTCPSTATYKAAGADTQQVVTSLLAGDHLDYAWVGAGLKNDAPADVILAFDLERHVPKEGATGTGMNVLTADGVAQFVDEATAKAIWAHFVSGTRPIRLSSCTTPAPTSAPSSTSPLP
jgi:hypothetical protein